MSIEEVDQLGGVFYHQVQVSHVEECGRMHFRSGLTHLHLKITVIKGLPSTDVILIHGSLQGSFFLENYYLGEPRDSN